MHRIQIYNIRLWLFKPMHPLAFGANLRYFRVPYKIFAETVIECRRMEVGRHHAMFHRGWSGLCAGISGPRRLRYKNAFIQERRCHRESVGIGKSVAVRAVTVFHTLWIRVIGSLGQRHR